MEVGIVPLEVIRIVESRYPGEVEELYRRGDEYLCVWTIPAAPLSPRYLITEGVGGVM